MGCVGVGFEVEVRASYIALLGKDLLGYAHMRTLYSHSVVEVVERNQDCIAVGNERRMIRLVVGSSYWGMLPGLRECTHLFLGICVSPSGLVLTVID